MTDVLKELQAYLDGDDSVVMSKRLVRETIVELVASIVELAAERTRYIELLDEMEACCDDRTRLRSERDALRAQLVEADEMLLNQARTIKEYQDAALNKRGEDE